MNLNVRPMRGATRYRVPSGSTAMQLPWTHGRIRLKNTREGASPTKSTLKDGDEFVTWLAKYRECLERIYKDAELARRESMERKGTI
jgi:hypothetical protein